MTLPAHIISILGWPVITVTPFLVLDKISNKII